MARSTNRSLTELIKVRHSLKPEKTVSSNKDVASLPERENYSEKKFRAKMCKYCAKICQNCAKMEINYAQTIHILDIWHVYGAV